MLTESLSRQSARCAVGATFDLSLIALAQRTPAKAVCLLGISVGRHDIHQGHRCRPYVPLVACVDAVNNADADSLTD